MGSRVAVPRSGEQGSWPPQPILFEMRRWVLNRVPSRDHDGLSRTMMDWDERKAAFTGVASHTKSTCPTMSSAPSTSWIRARLATR